MRIERNHINPDNIQPVTGRELVHALTVPGWITGTTESTVENALQECPSLFDELVLISDKIGCLNTHMLVFPFPHRIEAIEDIYLLDSLALEDISALLGNTTDTKSSRFSIDVKKDMTDRIIKILVAYRNGIKQVFLPSNNTAKYTKALRETRENGFRLRCDLHYLTHSLTTTLVCEMEPESDPSIPPLMEPPSWALDHEMPVDDIKNFGTIVTDVQGDIQPVIKLLSFPLPNPQVFAATECKVARLEDIYLALQFMPYGSDMTRWIDESRRKVIDAVYNLISFYTYLGSLTVIPIAKEAFWNNLKETKDFGRRSVEDLRRLGELFTLE